MLVMYTPPAWQRIEATVLDQTPQTSKAVGHEDELPGPSQLSLLHE
jgi:hypothetical protein